MHPTPVLLLGKPHGRRSLVGCSPWEHQELGSTERLHFHFSVSCIGEGNGNPLQCSCLESPRDGGARWGAVYGVAQSRTRLTRLSSSSSSLYFEGLCMCARERFLGGRHRPGRDYSQGIPNSRGLLEMQSLNSSPRNSNITDNYHLQILLLSYSTFNFICIHYANPYSYCAFYIKK